MSVERPYELHLTAVTGCDPAGDAARSATNAHVAMVHRGEDGTPIEVWRAALANHPAWWRVDPRRGWLVTFGNACSYALEHAVVVYDERGRVVRDYRVSDLFTADERRRMAQWSRSDEPRPLADDERVGNDIFSGAHVVFEDDAVWLTYNRVNRLVLLARR